MKLAIALLVALPSVAHAGGPALQTDVEVQGGDYDNDTAIDAKELVATASSTLCEKKPKLCHEAASLLDGDTKTAWCEGVSGDGEGETITITFAKAEKIDSLYLVPHFARSFALAEQNGRLSTVTITTDTGSADAELDDLAKKVKKENPVHENNDDCGDETCLSRDQRIQSGIGVKISLGYAQGDKWSAAPVVTKKLVLTIKGVYKGSKYHDTCISELTVHRAK